MNTDDIARYCVTERLRDERSVTIRAAPPEHKRLVIEAGHEVSVESLYRRLFITKKESTVDDLKQITEVEFVNTVALHHE